MSTQTTAGGKPGLDGYFKITQRGSTVEREIRGGVVTFITMAYIVVLNPLILGFAQDVDGQYLGGGDAPNLPAIAAGTALVAGVMTILMGVVANYPLALATGLGLNAFVAFSIASEMTWADAMGLVVIEGIIILVLVLTGFRTAVFHAIPTQLKVAISVGIGLFIALIGFVDAGFVHRIPDAANSTVPVQLGPNGELSGWPVVVFAFGMLLADRAVGAQGQGRDPHLDRGHHDPGHRRRGDRRPQGVVAHGPQGPGLRRSRSRNPTSPPSVSSRCWAPSRRSVWSRRSCWSSR